MTIRNQYPKARPQAIYNVLNSRQELPTNSVFSRASEATYVSRDGLMKTAAIDEPRFNYDLNTGEFLGLLLEAESTNLVSSSQAFEREDGWNPASGSVLNNQTIAPDGTTTGAIITSDGGGINNVLGAGLGGRVLSGYFKNISAQTIVRFGNTSNENRVFFNQDFEITGQDSNVSDAYFEDAPNGWKRLTIVSKVDFTTILVYAAGGQSWEFWGAQLEEKIYSKTHSYIRTSDSAVTREADDFSISTSANYDNGFSLLLDTDVGDASYIYKLATPESEGAVNLAIENGVLNWKIGGVSNQTQGNYPQVGFAQGRFRTISSLGAADGENKVNYLYTTGVSFPTVAAVPAGSQTLSFGVPQTLKAVYVWPEQLEATGAVNLIKGIENVIPFPDDISDALIFAYNCDPTGIRNTTVSWPKIQPNVNATWTLGDGSPDVGVTDGVTVTHNYPYPGVYKVQVVNSGDQGSDGFSQLNFNNLSSATTKVLQWSPEYRADAPGDGFTGDDLKDLFRNQNNLTEIPDFKYTDLTNSSFAFYPCAYLKAKGSNNAFPWSWIPTDLEEVVTVNGMFSGAFRGSLNDEERESFPQLKTSSKLLNVKQTFANSFISGFKAGGVLTAQAFTNTSNVTDFTSCFAGCKFTELIVDTTEALSLSGTFQNNPWITSPFFNAPNCTDFSKMFRQCYFMTSMSPSISSNTYSNGIDFTQSWSECKDLTSMPVIDCSSGERFTGTWEECESLTSFPLLDTSKGTNFSSAWYGCSGLTSFPEIDTSQSKQFSQTWINCNSLTSFPLLDFSQGTNFYQCWQNCSGLTSFPLIDTGSAPALVNTWVGCNRLTDFPAIDTSQCEQFNSTWYNCTSLQTFPVIDTSNGINFYQAWFQNASLVSFPALDLSKGTNFDRTWVNCRALEDFPPNMFDIMGTLKSNAFDLAFASCALTAQSIENILVSLDTNGQIGIELSIDGGTSAGKSAWTAAAVLAFDRLELKGWSIIYNE